MQARGPLMIEHRLIERMISLINKDFLRQIELDNEVEPELIDTAVDFISMYADRTHHGKEEDILFRDLKEKELSIEDRRLMDELIEEHAFGRRTTKSLAEANSRYRDGARDALGEISDNLKTLVGFYPRHI
ncbi:MAG: hemerythrin domain-containing protein, partial [Desulfobia sp.]